jgi:predicted O-linked N-acetylglucosamine transferase (SPINDLY family)
VGDALRQLQQGGVDRAVAYLAHLASQKSPVQVKLADRLVALAMVVVRQDPKMALTLAQKAIAHSHECMEAWVMAGTLLGRFGQRQQSIAAMLHVVQSRMAKPAQVLRAAHALARFGEEERAIAAATIAYEKLGKPLRFAVLLLYIAQRAADWDLVSALTAQIRAAYDAELWDEVGEPPRTHLLWCGNEATNIRVIARWSARSIIVPADVVPPKPQPLEGRRLRVGYLSSDFREHPGARLIEGLLRHHDRTKLELFMYCSGWDDSSAIRRRIESYFDHLHSVAAMSDRDAADLIRSHGVDVLIERNGPTHANRLGILAHRPAPVQIDYLGWSGSVGGRVVDYIVADSYVVPPGTEVYYPEKLIRLHKTYQVNDHAAKALPPKPERGAVGLPDNASLVLGMFNAINKVNGEVWAAWMQILRAIPNSILWLLDPGPAALKRIVKVTAGHGVDPARLIIARRLPQDIHLARMRCCDLMLDPWPYGGHTTTSDALFAGVPVITLEGTNFAGRVSGGLLAAAGLEELVQPTVELYIQTAVDLLRSPEKLGQVKQYIETRVPDSNVFNSRSKARQLEIAYRQAFQKAVSGRPFENIMFNDDP